MEPLIILCNLGRVRIVNFRDAGDDPREKPHLTESAGSTIEMRPDSVSEVVTDNAGRYPKSGPPGLSFGMSYGEEKGLEAELERQALQRIATAIGEKVAEKGNPPWHLVAPQPILPALIKALPASVRKSLVNTTPGDLTRLPLAKLESQLLQKL